jgi:hypothetical protein
MTDKRKVGRPHVEERKTLCSVMLFPDNMPKLKQFKKIDNIKPTTRIRIIVDEWIRRHEKQFTE